MGKRKRAVDQAKDSIPSDCAQHAPLVDLEPRSSEPAEISAPQSQPVIQVSGYQSPRPQGHFSGFPKLPKHSSYPSGRHYSRRCSSNLSDDASPSFWKGPSPYHPKFSFKLANTDLLDFPSGGIRDRAFTRPERIRSSSFSQKALYGDARRKECRLCQRRLKNPFISGSSVSATVAVLVCGHTYHAECLEKRTSLEQRHDPLCPLCLSRTV